MTVALVSAIPPELLAQQILEQMAKRAPSPALGPKVHHVPGTPRVLTNVSASQIDVYRRCHRLWAFDKIWGQRGEQTAAQARGTTIHSITEYYLKSGDLLAHELARFVKAAIDAQTLPPPGPDLLIEKEFLLPTFEGGPPALGYIDLVDPRHWAVPKRGRVLRVDDHKSTKDFKYCKSEEELRENTQMLLYAYWAYRFGGPAVVAHLQAMLADPATYHLDPMQLRDFPVMLREWEHGPDAVDVAHLYIRTASPGSRAVRTALDWPHVESSFKTICADVEEMAALVGKPPASCLEIQGNRAACDMYGGCPHREECGVSKSLIRIGHLINKQRSEAKKMDLKERLAQRRAANAAGAPDEQVDAGSPPAAITTDPDAAPAPDESLTPPDGASRVNVVHTPVGDAAPVVDVPDLRKGKGRGKARGKAASAPPEAQGSAAQTTAQGDPTQLAVGNVAQTTHPQGEGVNTCGAPRLGALPGDVVLIDCASSQESGAPLFRDAMAFEQAIAGIAAMVADEFGVSHWKLMEYGKGPGALSAAIQMARSQLPGVIYVNTGVMGADVFLEAVCPGARLVIRGSK